MFKYRNQDGLEMDLKEIDDRIIDWMRQTGTTFLRYAVAVIFIWFGMLKVMDASPASALIENTIYLADPSWFVPFLGIWEVAIGICFLIRPLLRVGIGLLAPQMVGTFLPLIVLPGVVYQGGNPFLLTMEGQYIVKNLLIIGAALVLGSTVRDP